VPRVPGPRLDRSSIERVGAREVPIPGLATGALTPPRLVVADRSRSAGGPQGADRSRISWFGHGSGDPSTSFTGDRPDLLWARGSTALGPRAGQETAQDSSDAV